MAKVKISEFDVNPDNNTDINNINIAEGCAPSGINNAIRQLMSDLKEFQTGAGGDPFNGAVNGTVGATTPNTGAFTTLSASSTVSGTGFSTYLASPPAIGGSTAAAGAFTSLSASGAFSANGGATLGDASGDALTINSSAVSIPNGLNFDSNTLVIDATNNRVGVGVASPTQALEVTGNIRLSGTAYFTDTNNWIANQSSNIAYRTGGDHILYTGGFNERMRITSTGNVGIGTSSPRTKLHVNGNAGYYIGNGSDGAQLYLGDGNFDSANFFNAAPGIGAVYNSIREVASDLAFYVYTGVASSRTERMRLDTYGNLGLGVTPAAWSSATGFQVQYATVEGRSSLPSFSEYGANTFSQAGTRKYIASDFASRYTQFQSVHSWYTAPSGTAGNAITFTQAMTLDASGNLGIGTTSPAYDLQVGSYGVDADSTLALASTTSGTGSIRFGDGTSGTDANAGLLRYDHSANAMIFWTNTTERMRIDSSGNVGIGTSSPDSKLRIQSDNTSGTAFKIRDGGTPTGNLIDVSSGAYGQSLLLTASGNLLVGTTSNTNASAKGIIAGSMEDGGKAVFDIQNTSTSSNSDPSPSLSCYKSSGTTTSSARFIQFYASAGVQPMGGIVGNGGTNVQFASISDAREKTNIQSINGSLNKINALNPVKFDWLANNEHCPAGFVAQEVEQVFPEFVVDNMSNDGQEARKGLTGGMTGGIVAHLVKAIQEQQAIINDLKARIETLETK